MIQTYIIGIKVDDRFLFCSDGLSDDLTENNISQIMSNKKNTADNDISNPRHKKDDISTIIIDINGSFQKNEVFKNYMQLGDRVNVVRSNGKIDSRYKIAHIKEGMATIMFMVDEHNSSVKNVSLDFLGKINILPSSIEDAKNIPDLYRYLKEIGNIKGGNKLYSSVDLIKIIDGVERRENLIETITRTDGSRNKIKELLKIN